MQSKSRLYDIVLCLFQELEKRGRVGYIGWVDSVVEVSITYFFCCRVNLETLSFYLEVLEEREEYGHYPGEPEGDWFTYLFTVCEVNEHNLSEKQLARLLYVYLARYVRITDLPETVWQPLRQIALGK